MKAEAWHLTLENWTLTTVYLIMAPPGAQEQSLPFLNSAHSNYFTLVLLKEEGNFLQFIQAYAFIAKGIKLPIKCLSTQIALIVLS